MNTAKVFQFPEQANGKKNAKRIINTDGVKYFNPLQIKLLRRTVRDAAILGKAKGQCTAIREWMLIDLLVRTGMREGEAADLRCGDIKTGLGQCEIFIRDGKGGRSRTIQIPDGLKTHLRSFLKWKTDQNEPTGEDDHILVGQRGAWTGQAVGQVVKKYLRILGLYEKGKSAHSLRHSYATEYYARTKDLRGLQKQLGHASIQTTQIYADVTKEDIQKEIKNLWN